MQEAAPADPGDASPRRDFRVLTRIRDGYEDAVMYDVQLQVVATGGLVWSQSFSDRRQATRFEQEVEDDLDELTVEAFRDKYSVPR